MSESFVHLSSFQAESVPVRRLRWPEPIARLLHIAEQQPLIETRPSLEALNSGIFSGNPLRTTFMGVGLASGAVLSESLPLDALGMLLTAEQVRSAVGATQLVVLIADSHARCNGIPTCHVEERAQHYAHLLDRVRRQAGLVRMRIAFASEIHRTVEYREIFREVEAKAPEAEHLYFKHEVADTEYFHRTAGGVVKVGWAMDGNGEALVMRDERAFDRRFRSWMGDHVPFVYCKAGRVFDDGKRKASPYLTLDPRRRLCLIPDEDVRGKLQSAQRQVSACTFRGVRKHLQAVARTYSKLIAPVRGTLEQRVEQILAQIFSGPALPG